MPEGAVKAQAAVPKLKPVKGTTILPPPTIDWIAVKVVVTVTEEAAAVALERVTAAPVNVPQIAWRVPVIEASTFTLAEV